MDSVSRLFPGPHNRRTTRVGIEHELLTRDCATGAPVAIERVRAATSLALAFEPGGQVELNLPCGPASVVVRRLRETLSALRSDLAAAGVELDASPVDRRTPEVVPLQLTSPRYAAMQAHFDSIGPAGPPVQADLGRGGAPHHPAPGRSDGVEVRLHGGVAR